MLTDLPGVDIKALHVLTLPSLLVLTLSLTACSDDSGGGGGNTAPVITTQASQSDFTVSGQQAGSFVVLAGSSITLDGRAT